jgi:hypothetical protein
LLTAINEHRLSDAKADEVEPFVKMAASQVRTLAADRIVDLRLDYGDIIRLAHSDAWMPGAGALALSRPSWWAWSQLRFEELTPLFAAVRAEQPESLPDWQASAMLGAARAFVDPTVRSRVLCQIALLGRGASDLGTYLRMSFERARAVTTRLGLSDPVVELPAVIEAIRSSQAVEDAEALLAELRAIAGC